MANGQNIAVVGATGAVGCEIISILDERRFPVGTLVPVASERSRGRTVRFRDREVPVEALRPGLFDDADVVLAAAGSFVSAQIAHEIVQSGAVMIDNSSHFRMQDDVPLIVPEVNPQSVSTHDGIIANPNCNAAIIAPVVSPILDAFGVERLFVATYQAASGAGSRAMDELERESEAILRGGQFENTIIPYQYAFNCFVHNTELMENGYVTEEWKVIRELRKILDQPALPINVHAVRVPVLRSHAEVVNITLSRDSSVAELFDLLESSAGVCVYGENGFDERGLGPTPVAAAGGDDVLVGRIRRDHTNPRSFDLWITGDQLRKGAALNAVQIAELLQTVAA